MFSLGDLHKITEEGVTFQSPINGDKLFCRRRESMEIQRALNSDIVMILTNARPTRPTEKPPLTRCA